MSSSCSQRELLRVVDREKVEIHVGNDISGRRSLRRRIHMSVAADRRHQQRQEHRGKKKTDSQASIFHEDSLSGTPTIDTSRSSYRTIPRFVGPRDAWGTSRNTSKLIDVGLSLAPKKLAGKAFFRAKGSADAARARVSRAI